MACRVNPRSSRFGSGLAKYAVWYGTGHHTKAPMMMSRVTMLVPAAATRVWGTDQPNRDPWRDTLDVEPISLDKRGRWTPLLYLYQSN